MSSAAPQAQLSDGVLMVSGHVDFDSVVGLRRQGEALITSGSQTLTVDLEALENAHSVVLSLLLCWRRLAAARNVELSFRGVSDRLASLAALSNLDAELPGFAPEADTATH